MAMSQWAQSTVSPHLRQVTTGANPRRFSSTMTCSPRCIRSAMAL